MNNDQSDAVIWFNGSFLPASEAAISPFNRGFLYGDGLFETLRAQDGKILHHEEHLERLNWSADALRLLLDPDVDFNQISLELLRMNALEREFSRIKWIVSRSELSGAGLPICEKPSIIITAEKYEPPDPEQYSSGQRLTVLPEAIPSTMASHKSLAYLFYLSCRQKALDTGFYDAVICDSDGNVAETSIASLMFHDGSKWIVPASSCKLPGITVSIAKRVMKRSGLDVVTEPVSVSALKNMKTVWLFNSLVGIMPVSQIDDLLLPALQLKLAENLRFLLFEG